MKGSYYIWNMNSVDGCNIQDVAEVKQWSGWLVWRPPRTCPPCTQGSSWPAPGWRQSSSSWNSEEQIKNLATSPKNLSQNIDFDEPGILCWIWPVFMALEKTYAYTHQTCKMTSIMMLEITSLTSIENAKTNSLMIFTIEKYWQLILRLRLKEPNLPFIY